MGEGGEGGERSSIIRGKGGGVSQCLATSRLPAL